MSRRGPGRTPQRITFDGSTLTITEWAVRLGVHRSALYHRLKYWPIGQALATPKNAINPRKKGRPASP